jgi:hypothetical protein
MQLRSSNNNSESKRNKNKRRKTPEIARNIIEQVNATTNEVVAIQVIKNVNGEEKHSSNFYVCFI